MSMAVFTLGFEITERFPALPKNKITNTSSKTNCKEQPSVIRHSNQHQQIGHTHLHHVESGLKKVEWATIFLEQVTEKSSGIDSIHITPCTVCCQYAAHTMQTGHQCAASMQLTPCRLAISVLPVCSSHHADWPSVCCQYAAHTMQTGHQCAVRDANIT